MFLDLEAQYSLNICFYFESVSFDGMPWLAGLIFDPLYVLDIYICLICLILFSFEGSSWPVGDLYEAEAKRNQEEPGHVFLRSVFFGMSLPQVGFCYNNKN